MQTLVSWIKYHLLLKMGADTDSCMCARMSVNRRNTRNATTKEFKLLNIQIKFVLESVTCFSCRLLPRCSSKEYFSNSDKYNSLLDPKALFYGVVKTVPYGQKKLSYCYCTHLFFFNQSVSLYLPTLFLGKKKQISLVTCFMPCLIKYHSETATEKDLC